MHQGLQPFQCLAPYRNKICKQLHRGQAPNIPKNANYRNMKVMLFGLLRFLSALMRSNGFEEVYLGLNWFDVASEGSVEV